MLDKEQCDVLCTKSSVNGGRHYTGFPLSMLLAAADAVDLTCRSGWQRGITHLGFASREGVFLAMASHELVIPQQLRLA